MFLLEKTVLYSNSNINKIDRLKPFNPTTTPVFLVCIARLITRVSMISIPFLG